MAKLVIKIIHLEKVLSNSPFVIIYSDEAHCNCARKYLISKKPGYIVRYGYMQHGYRDTVNLKKNQDMMQQDTLTSLLRDIHIANSLLRHKHFNS
jgi:transcriptional regulator of NAD metabolism